MPLHTRAAPPFAAAAPATPAGADTVVVFQPSHQSDTGDGYGEAGSCDAIVGYAMGTAPHYREFKVWSYNEPGLHHARTGTNTMRAHTSAEENGKISGYAWEVGRANALGAAVFISVHHNAGTGRHAVWAFVHDGDRDEGGSRVLAGILAEEVALATDLENRGVYPDSSTGRNDYRCQATGRLAFYSLDENVNKAPYRALLEIGDMGRDGDFLRDKRNRKAIGKAIKRGIARFLSRIGSTAYDAGPEADRARPPR